MKPLLLFVASMVAVATLRPAAMEEYLDAQHYDGMLVLPSPTAARWMSLGHRSAMADLFWLRGLIYVGDELHHRGDARFVYDLTRLMTDLDPDFRRAYLWAGVAGLYRAQGVTVEDMMPAVEFLRIAAVRFPDDGEIAWDLGATLRYEIAPHVRDRERRREIEEEASEYLATAARLGAGPPWLALSSAGELTRLGHLDRAAAHVREMIPLIDDPELREELLFRLSQLEGEAASEAIRVDAERLQSAAQRDYPWIPSDFAALLGERRVGAP